MEYLDNAGNCFARDIDSPVEEPKNEKCRECHIPLRNQEHSLCDVCLEMFNALHQTSYFGQLHTQWAEENQFRENKKRQMGE